MKSRPYLLSLILPPLCALLALSASVVAWRWCKDVRSSHLRQLETIAQSVALALDSRERHFLALDAAQRAQFDNPQLVQHLHTRLAVFEKHFRLSSLAVIGTPSNDADNASLVAYAPLKSQGETVAWVRAERSAAALQNAIQSLQQSMILGTLLIIALASAIVAFAIHWVALPLRQLNDLALQIAAGNYQLPIATRGPEEIRTLAHTLHTMSECLEQSISRLKERASSREYFHGEHECALLLQSHMLEKVIEKFHHPLISMKLLGLTHGTVEKGVRLMIDAENKQSVRISLYEALGEGFAGLVALNQQTSSNSQNPFTACTVKLGNPTIVSKQAHSLLPPLVWNLATQQFNDRQEVSLEEGGLVFLFSRSFEQHFPEEERLKSWLGRPLRHFGNEDSEVLYTMIEQEIRMFSLEWHPKIALQLLCIILKPRPRSIMKLTPSTTE